MLTLSNVARDLSTNSSKIREICSILNIEIRKFRNKNYLSENDKEKIWDYIKESKEESVSKEELDHIIQLSKQYKRTVCGSDLEIFYARFSEISDISIYRSEDIWICQGCKLGRRRDLEFKTLTLLKIHVNNHLEANHNVPYFTTERIDSEIENGKDIWGYIIEPQLI